MNSPDLHAVGANSPKLHRGWARLALFTLILVVSVASVLAIRKGVRRRRESKQRNVIAKLAEYQVSTELREGDVVRVSFSDCELPDDALASLAKLPQLRRVVLINVAVAGQGLRRLEKLQLLEELLCLGAPVTDPDMVHIGRLTNLRTLWLQDASITDDGLAHLVKLARLSKLNLIGTSVSDDGLTHLEDLVALRELYLHRTRVTPEGVDRLRQVLPSTRIQFDRPAPPN